MLYKPKELVNKKMNLLIGVGVFLFSLLIYYLTLARSLSFWDAGEYITCGSILGIPHPPGNPFYILLGRFFAIFSFGIPHAQVINFLSSLFSALAIMFTYFFSVKFVSMWIKPKEEYKAFLVGIGAAVYTAFSFTFWTNAIEAEVYSGLAFIINLIVWLTMIWLQKSEKLSHQNILLLIIYIFFLGFGIHQTSLQIAPAVLFIITYPMLKDHFKESKFWGKIVGYLVGIILIYVIFNQIGEEAQLPALAKYMFALAFIAILYYYLHEQVSNKAWILALVFFAIGLSTHIFLLIRSEFRPFINEGHPHNIELFTDYVLRRQYGPTSMFERRASFFYQMKDQFLTYFSWQFFHAETIARWFKAPVQFINTIGNFLVLFLGIIGGWFQYKKNKHSFAYFFAFFFMSSIAMIYVMNLSDAEVRVRDYFFTTAYNFWTFWMALGSLALIELIKPKLPKIILAIFLIALPVVNLASQYFIHDRSRELIALDYGQNILNSLDENAIVFTNGDNDTFPVWYAQAVYDPFAKEHIHPAQISDTISINVKDQPLIQPTETTKKIIKKAMDYKNEQCSGIRKDVTVANLSLLNTPWYIKQLRDLEGVEFNLAESHIDLCQENPSSALYPRPVRDDKQLTIKGATPADDFTVTFKKGEVLYVKDLAVIQIIKDNYGKRPIYFAVTTPDAIGFEQHLQNEGMVDRLVPTKGKNQFNMQRLITNIDSVYSYRGINDDSIYKDRNMKRLLNNYGAAFMRTSQFAHYQKDYDIAIKYMKKALDFIETKHRFYPSLSKLYLEASTSDLENIDKTFEYLKQAVYYDRDNRNLLSAVYMIAEKTEEIERGLALLEMMEGYQDSTLIENFRRRLLNLQSTNDEN